MYQCVHSKYSSFSQSSFSQHKPIEHVIKQFVFAMLLNTHKTSNGVNHLPQQKQNILSTDFLDYRVSRYSHNIDCVSSWSRKS